MRNATQIWPLSCAVIAWLCLPIGCVPEPDTRPTRMRLSGDCATDTPAQQRVVFVNLFANEATIELSPERYDTRLPRNGSLTRDGGDIRAGEFVLYGPVCPGITGPCAKTAPFIFCSVDRAGWSLQLTCIDSMFAPFCTGKLDEVEIH
jgi:hypothetical protein